MPILAYILLFIALGLVAYGFIIKAGGISKVPFYKADPNIDVREDELVRFASSKTILIGFVDMIAAVGMMLTGEDLMIDLVLFIGALLFTGFIFLVIKYAAKVFAISRN